MWEPDSDFQLDFYTQHLFLLGSPLALYCSIYNRELYVRDKLPRCGAFYNIFHPSDLIAYRIEPLIRQHPQPAHLFNTSLNLRLSPSQMYEDAELEPPVMIPCYWNKGKNYS